MTGTANRRDFLKAMGFGAAAMALPRAIFGGAKADAGAEKPSEKPNIVYIMADDLGYGDVGCFGATKVKTPNIDRVAAAGVRFTDAHTPSAVCSPTRYGVLTGRYPWRAGVYMHLQPNDTLVIRPGEVTVPSLLKSAGYATGCVGKWHLGLGSPPKGPDWNGELKPGPLEIGFDYYFGVPTSNNYPPFVYVEDHRVVGRREGEDIRVVGNSEKQPIPPKRKHEEIALTQTAKAIAFLERNKDRPLFLYLATCNVHMPHTPNGRFRGASQSGIYGDFIQELDWTVGEIAATLDRLGLADRTLLIVTSDNGATNSGANGHRSCGALRGWKAQIWEGGHRVPFVARWPGRIRPGTTCGETICLTDLLATSAAVVDKPLPKGAGPDSYNILPALLGQKLPAPIREATIHVSQSATDRAVRHGPWKLIFFRNGRQELYNLADDLGETTNLYDKRPDVVEQLTKLYDQYGARDERARAPDGKPAGRDALDGTGVDATGTFQVVRNCRVAKHPMGAELQAGTDGYALMKLPEPIRDRVTFEVSYKSTGPANIRNGFLTLGAKPDDEHLVKCGTFIRAGRHSIFQGPYDGTRKGTVLDKKVDVDGTFTAAVTVDFQKRTIEMAVDAEKLTFELPKDLTEIGYVGCWAYRTRTAFGRIARKPAATSIPAP